MKLFITDIDGCLTDGGYYSPSVPEFDVPGMGFGNRFNLPSDVYLRRFNTRDFVGIHMLHQAGIQTVALTGSNHPCKPHFDRSAPYMKLIAGVEDKYEYVKTTYVECLPRPSKCSWDEIAFIGDELNDARLLMEVGLASCPADAAPEVRKIVEQHKNGIVMERKGGDRCVREFTDYIRKLKSIPASWVNWKENDYV